MKIQVIPKQEQGYGEFNNGEIVENKPVGFPQDGGTIKAYSNIFYWANAKAGQDSTIGLHPHQGFEIMSFVLEGRIRHFDTKLKEWRELEAGDVQIIRAGNGISHAEHMEENARMFQIWFDPNLSESLKKEASYNDYKRSVFPSQVEDGIKRIEYVGEKGPIEMDSENVDISKWILNSTGHQYKTEPASILSIYVLEGELWIDEERLAKDDFVLLSDTAGFKIEGKAELFVIQSDKKPSYKTYAQLTQESMRG